MKLKANSNLNEQLNSKYLLKVYKNWIIQYFETYCESLSKLVVE